MKIADRALRLRWLAAALPLCLVACQTTGGRTSFLLFGGPDDTQGILVERVRGARGEISGAHEDFLDAFHLFQRLTAPQAVELGKLSGDFEDALGACRGRAERLRARILAIRGDSDALAAEWKAELEHFSGDALRKKSESMMTDTQQRAQKVIAALERIQARMEPVLLKLQDYALFFNHNLSPRAIATLEDTYEDFDDEIQALGTEIEKAQSELNSFLDALEGRVSTK